MDWLELTKTNGKSVLVNLGLVTSLHNAPPGTMLHFGAGEDDGTLAVQEPYAVLRERLLSVPSDGRPS